MFTGTFLEKQMVVDAQVYFWVLCSILVYVSERCLCQHHTVFIIITVWSNLKSDIVMPKVNLQIFVF